ncbi:MAG TPA: 4-hydroxyphenylpyruvate dioxygenase [Acidimicrobiales bacterium]|nr:4-hydroxyphenylpyruvate dioxygenase [Acidimicrobiales bacterium]
MAIIPTTVGGLPAPATFLTGWDYLEFWVGNARAFTQFMTSGFGFRVTGYAGPETGVTDRTSYVLEQGDIRFVVTGGLAPHTEVTVHVQAHGDGVRNIAFAASDAYAAYGAAVERGASGRRPSFPDHDADGRLHRATIAAYGDTQHTFVDRSEYSGAFAPGYIDEGLPPTPCGPDVGLRAIDHVVANVEQGALDRWVDFYRHVLGFDQLVHFDDEQISTEYSALMSTVVWDGSRIVLPINEPATGRKKSQIDEYLDAYGAPGVQHIAMRTNDIVAAVGALRDRGVRFLAVPDAYYEEARRRVDLPDLPWAQLQRLGVLVDRDDDGYLLQIFTETVTDRPTVFFEIIQREGARGFGAGNFKALFEAIEREQARRGHL